MTQESKQEAYKSLLQFQFTGDGKKKTVKKDPAKKKPQKCEEEPKEEINHDIPNRTLGDYFCALCDAHMNSEQMWENHIQGKRHLKSSRKTDPADQKYEYLSEDPIVQKELDEESRPMAGLEHICEVQRNDQKPIYQCFLCSASLVNPSQLIDHLLGLKHRKAFLKEYDKEKYNYIETSQLTKAYLEPIVEDLIMKYENDHGRKKISVKREKPKAGSSYKKKNDDEGTSYKRKHEDEGSSSYKRSYEDEGSSYKKKYDDRGSSSYKRKHDDEDFYEHPSKYSSRPKERHSESEWRKVSPVPEISRERRYADRSHHSDEEQWKKVDPDPIFCKRPQDIPDSNRDRPVKDYSLHAAHRETRDHNDLREVLEQRKSHGIAATAARANVAVSEPATTSSEMNDVLPLIGRLVSDMSPELFLTLALFKLEQMNIQSYTELQLLNRVGSEATTLALKVMNKLPNADLKTKYEGSLAQNGVSSRCEVPDTSSQSKLQFMQNLDNFVGHYKACKTTTSNEESHSSQFPTSHLRSPENLYINNSTSTTMVRQYPDNPLYQETLERNKPVSYNTEWNQRSSNFSLPFRGFSSSNEHIPGLTLTEESTQPSAPIQMFAQAANNIFGSINVPATNPHNQVTYSNADYNRLNFRY